MPFTFVFTSECAKLMSEFPFLSLFILQKSQEYWCNCFRTFALRENWIHWRWWNERIWHWRTQGNSRNRNSWTPWYLRLLYILLYFLCWIILENLKKILGTSVLEIHDFMIVWNLWSPKSTLQKLSKIACLFPASKIILSCTKSSDWWSNSGI